MRDPGNEVGIWGLRSFGSWCIKGADESTLGKDSSVPLVHHDPNDLSSQGRFRILPRNALLINHKLRRMCTI